jgi:ZIP family zinc transporter
MATNHLLLIIFISFLGPAIGSFLGVVKKYSEKQIGYMLSFAAGVMVYVSLFNLIPESLRNDTVLLAGAGIGLGMIFMHLMNFLVPHYHHSKGSELSKREKIKRLAIFVFIGIFIHNLPEGIAIGVGALSDLKFSFVIAMAIAFHDIPEAICIAAPLYYANGNKIKSFFITTITVIPTIVGFLVTYYFFNNLSSRLLGLTIGFTAGVMLYMSFFELLPSVFNGQGKRPIKIMYFFVGCLFVFILGRFFI